MSLFLSFSTVLIEDASTPNIGLDNNGDDQLGEQNDLPNLTDSKENKVDNDSKDPEKLNDTEECTKKSQAEMVNNIEEHHHLEEVEQVESIKEDTLTIISSILEDLITQITETEKKRRKKKKKHKEPHMGMGHFLQYLKGEGDEENVVSKTHDDNAVNTSNTDIDAEVWFLLVIFLNLLIEQIYANFKGLYIKKKIGLLFKTLILFVQFLTDLN